MNDLKALFRLALSDGHGPDPQVAADPAADVLRGRALLRRRRSASAASLATAGLLAGAVAVPLVLGSGPATAPRGPTALPTTSASRGASSSPTVLPSVALVAYDGAQPPGYTVAALPEGWVVQGGDAFALTIARKDDPDTEPASFAGKLVVMLQSSDAPPPDAAHLADGEQRVSVDGRPGVLRVEAASAGAGPDPQEYCVTVVAEPGTTVTRTVAASQTGVKEAVPCSTPDAGAAAGDAGGDAVPATQILTYALADGRQVVVQAPVSLGWDAARLVRFAEGVTVLGHAQAGVG